jgi:predicted NBD/HSP70 family sugar kinase
LIAQKSGIWNEMKTNMVARVDIGGTKIALALETLDGEKGVLAEL